MKYFKKEGLHNPVFGGDKKAIQFEFAGNTGVIALDEFSVETIKILEDHADKRRMGVVRISPEIYESLKKNEASTPSPRLSGQNPLNKVRTSMSPNQVGQKGAVPRAEVAANGAPVGRDAAPRVIPSEQPPTNLRAFKARTRHLGAMTEATKPV